VLRFFLKLTRSKHVLSWIIYMNFKNIIMSKDELTISSFDAIHGIVCDHLIEKYGECDHDKHGELMYDLIVKLKTSLK